jgi:hypothetical protein
MMKITEDYNEKKKTMTLRVSRFLEIELPKELKSEKSDQKDPKDEIQRDLDQRMKYESDAELLALVRNGQLTFDKKLELLKQQETMELAAAAGVSEKQLLIKEQYFVKEQELYQQHMQELAGMAANIGNILGGAYTTWVQQQNAVDDESLRNYQKNLNQKKRDLDNSLDHGIISRDKYNQQLLELDQTMAEETARIEKEKAQREFNNAMVLIAIKEAVAIAEGIVLATSSSKSWYEGVIAVIASVATIVTEVSVAWSKLDRARSAQYAKGKYDVIGSDDGRLYQNVPFTGPAQTGIYPRPALISEQGGELIVDAPTTRNLQMNYPWILSAINYARTPQHAEGVYPGAPGMRSPNVNISGSDPELTRAVNRLNKNIERGTFAKIIYDDMRNTQDQVELIQSDVTK